MTRQFVPISLACAVLLLAGCPKSNAGNGPPLPSASASAAAAASAVPSSTPKPAASASATTLPLPRPTTAASVAPGSAPSPIPTAAPQAWNALFAPGKRWIYKLSEGTPGGKTVVSRYTVDVAKVEAGRVTLKVGQEPLFVKGGPLPATSEPVIAPFTLDGGNPFRSWTGGPADGITTDTAWNTDLVMGRDGVPTFIETYTWRAGETKWTDQITMTPAEGLVYRLTFDGGAPIASSSLRVFEQVIAGAAITAELPGAFGSSDPSPTP